MPYTGFKTPRQSWCKVPHELFEQFPRFTMFAEILVVLYVLRQTWGYQDYEEARRITLDEFSSRQAPQRHPHRPRHGPLL